MEFRKKYMQLCYKKNVFGIILLIYINYSPPDGDFLKQIFGC